MKKMKIGIAGYAHMHITTLVDSFLAMPDAFEFIGCADAEIDLVPLSREGGTRFAVRNEVLRKCAPIKEYESIEALLALDPDLLLVTVENTLHGQVVSAALARGIHVIVEKPMAATYAEACQMARLAKDNNVLLITNWPTAWFKPFRTAARLASEGHIGRLLRFSYSNAESLGPFSYGQQLTDDEKLHEWWYHERYGGGVLFDYLGYGCSLSRWVLGEKATAAFAYGCNLLCPFADIDDHASLILSYPGAQALIEGTWATYASGQVPTGPIVYGDCGTLVADRHGASVALYTQRRQTTPTQVFEGEPLPEGRETLAAEFLHALRHDGQLHPLLSPALNLDAMAALDAAIRSAKSGKMEQVL